MSVNDFSALIVDEAGADNFSVRVGKRSVEDLPAGDVLVKVHYSSLNYKDALSATGQFGITKKYPHTPGIDAAGEVVESAEDTYKPGDQVVVTSYDLGMDTAGGFGQYIRVPAQWVVPLPDGLGLRDSMVLGTAGLTAGLMVWKLVRNGVKAEDGDILVTGATGGVGSVAVALLAKAGYRVVAATGKTGENDYLHSLGATRVISRDEVMVGMDEPLMKERWAGVVDVAGGEILAAAIKSTRYDGTVTCCGLARSTELPISVLPFILRGVSLLGVDSVQCPMEPRLIVWNKLANEWKLDNLDLVGRECILQELEKEIHAILKGSVRGRIVVNLLNS
jgi:putative YhdH/YhfP family quinone oxidoreductase